MSLSISNDPVVWGPASISNSLPNRLEEECDNMAREGLRTLVFGMKAMSQDDYAVFAERWAVAI